MSISISIYMTREREKQRDTETESILRICQTLCYNLFLGSLT